MPHPVVWHSPSPLWRDALADADRRRFRRPEVLRFATDAFVDDLQQRLATDPAGLRDLVLRAESWRAPDAGWLPGTAVNGTPAFDPDAIPTLFQPAHQRFYLVGATLACQARGLPDKAIDPKREERVTFVVRRLVSTRADGALRPSDPATFDEYGWDGAAWVRIADPAQVDAREERQPLFPMVFGENGHRRRLLAGLIPAARREAYEAAPRENTPPPPAADLAGDPLADPRRGLFDAGVRDALRHLRAALDAPTSLTDAEARDVLAFALLDLADFLNRHLTPIWQAVEAGNPSGLGGEARAVYDALDARIGAGTLRWRTALADVYAHRTALLDGQREDAALALVLDGLTRPQIRTGIDALVGPAPPPGTAETNPFVTALERLLAATPPPGRDAFPDAPPEVDVGSASGAVYVIRCVYDRPRCHPFRRPLVSPPTQAFRLASFFHPDAPARPVRITMPVDTSLSGLRKFPRNVSVLLSDELRKQMARVKGLSALEDGDAGEAPEWTLGMICSLSIPIITICALILLMILVQLLNIVFWWLPFFKICFPIPLKK